MDYEKKYKEVVAFIRECTPDENGFITIYPQEIFPELKESEDEKIRQELLDAFKASEDSIYLVLTPHKRESFIAWLEKQGEKDEEILILKDQIESLHAAIKAVKETHKIELEKQGEQKPAEMVEPKFHEGDMIIHKEQELGEDYIHNIHKIIQVDILNKKYHLEDGLVVHFSEQDDYELLRRNLLGLNRMKCSQPKSAWSEEDEKNFARVNYACLKVYGGDSYSSDWLRKFLGIHKKWKPSDEQMAALKKACDEHWEPDGLDPLYTLYQNLKKLREE